MDENERFIGHQDSAPEGSLKLPIQREPEDAWEYDPTKWLCVDDFDPNAND